MKKVDAPPPSGTGAHLRRWPQVLDEIQDNPHQWYEFLGKSASSVTYVQDMHLRHREEFYCVTRNWRDGRRRCDMYLIYSPGKDPMA